jgi:alpha-galactosidase
MAAGLKVKLGQDDSVSAQEVKRLLEQYINIRRFYYGDYYPLTPYSQDNTVWLAWQFDCPEDGEGMVQAFRREESVYESAQFKLRGLSPDANYTIGNIDFCGSEDITGRVLMEKGLVVSIPDRPGAVVITYKKK